MTRFAAIFAMILVLAIPARALDDDVAGYVESNLLAIFYHELGHALIDLMGLPVFGQEEDAADVLSIVLIDAFFEEEAAVQIAYDTAFGFYDDAQNNEPIFWGVHGPDLQRYYTLVCLFYGANPAGREDVADELGLPAERAETCEEEFDLAADSWGGVLDELAATSALPATLVLEIDTRNPLDQFTAEVMDSEINALAEDFDLPRDLEIAVAPCGEPNAFYDPSQALIIMCTELTEYLAETAL